MQINPTTHRKQPGVATKKYPLWVLALRFFVFPGLLVGVAAAAAAAAQAGYSALGLPDWAAKVYAGGFIWTVGAWAFAGRARSQVHVAFGPLAPGPVFSMLVGTFNDSSGSNSPLFHGFVQAFAWASIVASPVLASLMSSLLALRSRFDGDESTPISNSHQVDTEQAARKGSTGITPFVLDEN